MMMRLTWVTSAYLVGCFATAAIDKDSAISPDAVKDSNFRFFEPEDMRESPKWHGFVGAMEAAGAGDWERTRRLLFKLREFIPENLMLMEQAARLHMLNEEWRESESVWYEIFARKPGRTDVLPELAWVLLQQKKDAEAERIVNVVLNRKPRHLESRLIRAVIHSRKTRNRVADDFSLREVADLCYQLSADPRSWSRYLGEDGYRKLVAYVFRSGVWTGRVRMNGSLQDLAQQARQNGSHLIQLEKAMALHQNVRARKALNGAKTGGISGPLLEAYDLYLKAREGEKRAARSGFEILVNSYPNRRLLRHLQAAMLVELNEGSAALYALTPLLEADPNADEMFQAILCHQLMENPDEAWKWFHRIALHHRADLLRLLRQEEPLLGNLRNDSRFLEALRPKEDDASTVPQP